MSTENETRFSYAGDKENFRFTGTKNIFKRLRKVFLVVLVLLLLVAFLFSKGSPESQSWLLELAASFLRIFV